MSKLAKALLAELARVSARLAKIEAKQDEQDRKDEAAKPEPPSAPWVRPQIDLLRHAAPPPSPEVVAAGAAMKDIASDRFAHANIHTPRSMIAPLRSAPTQPVQRGTGWQPETAGGLKPPAGVAILDRLMDAQDAQDRAEANERANRAAKLSKPMPPPKPKQLDSADLDELMGGYTVGGKP